MEFFIQYPSAHWGDLADRFVALFSAFRTRSVDKKSRLRPRSRSNSGNVGLKDSSEFPEPTSLMSVGQCFDLSFYMKNSEDDKDSMLVFILERGVHWAIFDLNISAYLRSVCPWRVKQQERDI